MADTQQDLAKSAAGVAAAEFVESGMYVGLGTGSTAAYALRELGRRIQEEKLSIHGVPTSFASYQLARKLEIPLATFYDVAELDVAIDGADEVDPAFRLIKGRGAAMTREKIVACHTRRFIVLIDPSKKVERLGTTAPVPVEVLPMAVKPVSRALQMFGGIPELRIGKSKDGPVITDQGFWVLDVRFEGGITDPEALNRLLNDNPGVLGHGLFLDQTTDLLIGEADGNVSHLRL
jgi:ribose 5-phosphate isomerase A